MKSKRNDAFQNKSIKVPFVVPNIDSSDKKAIAIALKSNLLTDGPILRKFEKEFSRFTGSKYAIGVSNATSALQLSLKSLGIGKGDEVIIPDITFVATANAVLFTGATPVLADVNDAGARQLRAEHCRDQRGREHTVCDGAAEARTRGVFAVEMHRVGVARNAAEQHYVAFCYGAAVEIAHADREVFKIVAIEFAVVCHLGLGFRLGRHCGFP